MAARMAAQRGGFADETEIERCRLFSTLSGSSGAPFITRIQLQIPIIILDSLYSPFPHQQVPLGRQQ